MGKAAHIKYCWPAHDVGLLCLVAHALHELAVGGHLVDVIDEVKHKRGGGCALQLVRGSYLHHLPSAPNATQLASGTTTLLLNPLAVQLLLCNLHRSLTDTDICTTLVKQDEGARLLKMTTWSASSKASSWSCVTRMLVTPTLSMMLLSPCLTDARICKQNHSSVFHPLSSILRVCDHALTRSDKWQSGKRGVSAQHQQSFECRGWLTVGSRAPKGSSSSSKRGWEARARASATRCRCPPDSWAGRLLPTWGSSMRSSSSLTLQHRLSVRRPTTLLS